MDLSIWFYLLIGSFVILCIAVYVIVNLVKKEEKLEEVIESYIDFLKALSTTVENSKKHIESLDERGVFRSDDEIGYFFEQMKEVQNKLNSFIIPGTLYGGEEKKKKEE